MLCPHNPIISAGPESHAASASPLQFLLTPCGPPAQVLTTLGFLLEPIQGVMQPLSRWYRLTRRRATDRVGGEICFLVVVGPKYAFDVLKWSEEPSTLLDPQMLKVWDCGWGKRVNTGGSLHTYLRSCRLNSASMSRQGCVQYTPAACLFSHSSSPAACFYQVMLCNYSLQLCIDEIHRLRTSQSATDVGAMLKKLSLQVRCVQNLNPLGWDVGLPVHANYPGCANSLHGVKRLGCP